MDLGRYSEISIASHIRSSSTRLSSLVSLLASLHKEGECPDMRKQKLLAKEFEFYFPDLDNIILVESPDEENVRIRFTKNNLSEKRRVAFVHRLAAEGFIPDHFQWYSGSTFGSLNVQWLHDCSWVKLPEKVIRRSNRFMKLLLAGACLFWIAMMRVVTVTPQHSETSSRPRGALALCLPPQPAETEKTGSLVPQ